MPTTIRGDDFYLGDGYYAAFDGYQVRVYTSVDEHTAEYSIYLSPAVLAVFLGWLQRKFPAQFANGALIATRTPPQEGQ